MFSPKKPPDQSKIRLPKASNPPEMSVLQYMHAQALENRSREVELIWAEPDSVKSYSMGAKLEAGNHDPTWTLWEDDGQEGKLVWRFETSDFELINDVVCMLKKRKLRLRRQNWAAHPLVPVTHLQLWRRRLLLVTLLLQQAMLPPRSRHQTSTHQLHLRLCSQSPPLLLVISQVTSNKHQKRSRQTSAKLPEVIAPAPLASCRRLLQQLKKMPKRLMRQRRSAPIKLTAISKRCLFPRCCKVWQLIESPANWKYSVKKPSETFTLKPAYQSTPARPASMAMARSKS